MSTWIFLRGLMREARHWGQFPQQFAAALPDARIVTPDLPGNGRLYRQASPTRVMDMVEHCRRQLRDEGYAPPYRVLALSLGGMVAVAWSERYPDEIDRLVLLGTSMRPHNRFDHRLRPANYPLLLRHALGGVARRERMILHLTSNRADPADQRAQRLAEWETYARECPVSRRNALRQLLAAARFRASGGPTQPCLILAGAGDRLVDARCSAQLASAWKAELRIHPTAGHDLPLDDGPWVAGQVRDWCLSLPATA